jgi:hypothetical protein
MAIPLGKAAGRLTIKNLSRIWPSAPTYKTPSTPIVGRCGNYRVGGFARHTQSRRLGHLPRRLRTQIPSRPQSDSPQGLHRRHHRPSPAQGKTNRPLLRPLFQKIGTMEPIEPPWQVIKEWIADAPLWPCSQQDPPPDLGIMICRPWVATAFPTTNPTSTGSTVPGINPIPILMASISAPAGSQPKSVWTMAASWFSKIPDAARRTTKKAAAINDLGKADRGATLWLNEYRRDSSRFRQVPALIRHFFTETPLPPFSPATPTKMRTTSSKKPLATDRTSFPRPPVRPNGSFWNLPQKANS